jgi:hypothetical protein
MNPLHKGILATFFGVVIGSLVALAINQFWLLGALIGAVFSAGCSAYMLFDIKKIGHAVSVAWITTINWRLPKENREFLKLWVASGFIGSTWITTAFTVFMLCSTGTMPSLSWYNKWLLFFSIYSGCIFGFAPWRLLTGVRVLENYGFLVRTKREFLWQFALANPCTGPLLWFYYIIRGMMKLIPRLVWSFISFLMWFWGTALPTFGRFVKLVFVLIHCRDRIMCLVDSSFGMIAAFYIERWVIGGSGILSISSILAGGVTGTALFFFNRKIVAVRWLKLQPNGN